MTSRVGIRRRPIVAIGIVAAVLVLGCAATLLAWRSEHASARERDQQAADVAAASLSEVLLRTIASFRGVDGLAIDGRVSPQEFAAFAADILPGSLFRAIAYSEVVPDADRQTFERGTGLTIRDTDGKGDFVPASSRDPHLVVVSVAPVTDSSATLLGFDIASDPTRREAATAAALSSESALSEPIRLADSAAPGVFAVHRVVTPDGRVIGYVSSGMSIADLVAAAASAQGESNSLSLFLGSTRVAGTEVRGRSASFDSGGKTFLVNADAPDDIHLGLVWLTALGTLLLAMAVAISYRRDRLLTTTLARSLSTSDAIGARNRAVVGLGERLAAAADSDAVITVIARGASSILGASHTDVARRYATAPTALLVRHGSGPDQLVQAGDEMQPLDAPSPLADCVRTKAPIVLSGRAELESKYPHLSHDDQRSVICVPLVFHSGECAGAIGFTWTDRDSFTDIDHSAVAMIAELSSRALERAVIAELVQGGAARLSELTQALTSAASATEVIEVVRRLVPPVLGARHALVAVAQGRPSTSLLLDQGLDAFSDEVVGVYRSIELTEAVPSVDAFIANRPLFIEDRGKYLERYPDLEELLDHMGIVAGAHVPVHDARGASIGVLSIAWAQPMVFSGTVRSVLATIGDAVGQTLTRASMYDQEHELIVELQSALLAPVPHVDGLEIAVRYEPAVSVVGIGGDWYDAVVTASGRFLAVIGDVTGHGAEAVAIMAQVQAVMAHLLRIDTPAEHVLAHASTMLANAGTYATAQIIEVDVASETLVYVNAGHPYPVLRRASGEAETLTGGRRPLLGIDAAIATAARCAFRPGDEILLYTDGLIERRQQSISDHIERLVAVVASDTDALPIARALDRLVTAARATSTDSGDPIDDDLAAVLIRFVGRGCAGA